MKKSNKKEITFKELFEIVPPRELKDSIEFLLFQHLKHSPKEKIEKRKIYEDIQLLLMALS